MELLTGHLRQRDLTDDICGQVDVAECASKRRGDDEVLPIGRQRQPSGLIRHRPAPKHPEAPGVQLDHLARRRQRDIQPRAVKRQTIRLAPQRDPVRLFEGAINIGHHRDLTGPPKRDIQRIGSPDQPGRSAAECVHGEGVHIESRQGTEQGIDRVEDPVVRQHRPTWRLQHHIRRDRRCGVCCWTTAEGEEEGNHRQAV